MWKVPAILLLLSLSLYSCALRAQTTNGSITGRMTDPSKASVPEAKVAAVNTGTNFRYETAANGAGEYTLANHEACGPSRNGSFPTRQTFRTNGRQTGSYGTSRVRSR